MKWYIESTYNHNVSDTLGDMGFPFNKSVEIDGIVGSDVKDQSSVYGIYGKVGPLEFYKSYWLQEYVFNKHKIIYATFGSIRPYSYNNVLIVPNDIELTEEDKEKIVAFMIANGDFKIAEDGLIKRINIIPQGEDEPIRLEEFKDWFHYVTGRDKNGEIYPAIPIRELATHQKKYKGVITQIDGDAYLIGSWFGYRDHEIAIGITGEYVVINDRRIKAKFLNITLSGDRIETFSLPEGLTVEELARKYAWAYKNQEHYSEDLGTVIYANFSFLKPDWKLFVGHWYPPKI